MLTHASDEITVGPEEESALAPEYRPAVVAVDSVYRRFGETLALADVSLQVRAGEIHALLGPNGAGKTTLLRVLAGLVVPNAGSVHVLGFDSTESPTALRRAVGVVLGVDRSFYLRIAGLENLAFFARLHGMSRKRATARSLELLGQVDLADAAQRPVGTCSHGMQKRLAGKLPRYGGNEGDLPRVCGDWDRARRVHPVRPRARLVRRPIGTADGTH